MNFLLAWLLRPWLGLPRGAWLLVALLVGGGLWWLLRLPREAPLAADAPPAPLALSGTPVPISDPITPATATQVGPLALLSAGTPSVLQLSPDGRWLAASSRATLTVHDTTTLERVRYFATPLSFNSRLNGQVAIANDGATVAVASGRKLWLQPATGPARLLENEEDEGGSYGPLAFAPDGATLITSDERGLLFIRVSDGAVLRVEPYQNEDDRERAVMVAPDNSTLLTIAQHRAYLRQLRTGRVVSELALNGDNGMITTAMIGPGGYSIALGTDLGVVQLVGADGIGAQTVVDGGAPISSIAFDAAGNLAIGSRDGQVTLWDGTELRKLVVHNRDSSPAVLTHFAPNGNLFVGVYEPYDSASSSVGIRVSLSHWNPNNGARLAIVEQEQRYVEQLVWSANSATLDVQAYDDTKQRWRVADASFAELVPAPLPGDRWLAVFPNSAYFTLDNGVGRLWRLADGALPSDLIHGKTWVAGLLTLDGTILATRSGSEIVLLRTSDGATLHALRGPPDPVYNGVLSPDGTLLLAGSRNSTYIWRIADGSLVRRIRGDFAALSPDGTTIVTRSDFGVGLWELASGALRHEVALEGGWINSVVFAPDGTTVTVGTGGGDVSYVVDVAAGAVIGRLTSHRDYTGLVAVAPDGTLVATAGSDYVVRLWSLPDGRAQGQLQGHSSFVSEAAFSPDNRLLATLSSDRTIRIWQRADKQLLHRIDFPDTRAVDAIAFSEDGASLLGNGEPGEVWRWEVSSGALLESPPPPPSTAKPSPDGQLLASATARQVEFRRSDGTLVHSVAFPGDQDEEVWELVFAPDGATLAVHMRGGKIVLVRVAEGTLGPALVLPETAERYTPNSLDTLAFAPNSAIIATGTRNGEIILWSLADGALLQRFPAHQDAIDNLAFSPDGRLLASTGRDDTLRLWGVRSL